MRIKFKHLLFLSLTFLVLCFSTDAQMIADAYLSPEHLYHDKSTNQIYIGLATYPGVAVYDMNKDKISRIIPMPSPVTGVIVDEKKQMLYAGAKGGKAELYVYDIGKGKAGKNISTGHGPSGMVISDEKDLLYVANRFSNDVSVIDLKNHKEIKRIEVDREPVSVTLSPDGSVLAVANLLPSQSAMQTYISSTVSLIDAVNFHKIENVALPNGAYALKDILFSNDGNYIYVTHLTGRYNVLTNQIEKGWINTNSLSIIDAKTQELYTTVLLDDIYKGAANPCGLNLSEDGKKLFVAVSGTDELFVIDRLGMHKRIESTKGRLHTSQTTIPLSGKGNGIQLFENSSKLEPIHVLFEQIPNELSFLAPVRLRIKLEGNGPAYMVSKNNSVYITSYFSDGIDVVRLNEESIEKDFVEIGNKDIAFSEERYGALLFHSAENCFQQWQSCASCHPGEGRVDGLNWDLMNDGIGNPKNTKSLLYTHSTPPAMISGIRKDANACVRAGFKYIQFFDAEEEKSQAVDAYLKSLRPVPSPYLVKGKLSKSAKLGKKLFEEGSCIKCHSGAYFTNLQQYEMGTLGKYDKQLRWDTPTLIEVWRTAPYLHDGRYANLEDVFKVEKHGLKEPLSDADIKNLTEYLLSL